MVRYTQGSKPKIYKCQKVARITTNGYLNFLRDFKKRCCGLAPRDMVRYGAQAWNKLSCCEKARFRNQGLLAVRRQLRRAKNKCASKKPRCGMTRKFATKASNTSCGLPKKPKCKRPRSPCEVAKKSTCKKPRVPCRVVKKSTCKKRRPACGPIKKPTCKNRRPICGANKMSQKKKRCSCSAKKKKPVCPQLKASECEIIKKEECSKLGPNTANGYLKYLKEFRRQNWGLKPRDLLRKAAKNWCTLTVTQRYKYEKT